MVKSHLSSEEKQQSSSYRHPGTGTGEASSDSQIIRSYGSNSHHRRSNGEIIGDSDKNKRRDSLSLSECCIEIVDLESGMIHHHNNNNKNNNGVDDDSDDDGEAEERRDCRICHLSLDLTNQEIELGCSCKDDLAAAHKHCAEAWFKIKGNKTCEICGSVARNVVGASEGELVEQWNDATTTAQSAAVTPNTSETRNFWQGHRFLNFLLACMVFAFVISWLFHFNVPS